MSGSRSSEGLLQILSAVLGGLGEELGLERETVNQETRRVLWAW